MSILDKERLTVSRDDDGSVTWTLSRPLLGLPDLLPCGILAGLAAYVSRAVGKHLLHQEIPPLGNLQTRCFGAEMTSLFLFAHFAAMLRVVPDCSWLEGTGSIQRATLPPYPAGAQALGVPVGAGRASGGRLCASDTAAAGLCRGEKNCVDPACTAHRAAGHACHTCHEVLFCAAQPTSMMLCSLPTRWAPRSQACTILCCLRASAGEPGLVVRGCQA